MNDYVVATVKEWNIQAFERNTERMSGRWHLITRPDNLTVEYLLQLKPKYIFFPHWSWIVPVAILNCSECVCFHMTDLPYGIGGSPLQNLILRGHKTTKLTALRMVEQVDRGPIYCNQSMTLDGSAQEIYERAADKIYNMIEYVIKNELVPKPQKGKETVFDRRTPALSVLPENGDLVKLYDHIRMLDADTYPRATINYGEYRITLSDAELSKESHLTARVKIELSTAEEKC